MKTRVFMSSPLLHLLLSQHVFGHQNDVLVDSLLQHPSTIGIGVPSWQFLDLYARHRHFGNYHFGTDGAWHDNRINLGYAAVVRAFRKQTIDSSLHPLVDALYDTSWCGFVTACGLVLQICGERSGGFNTAHDNSLLLLSAALDSWFELAPPHLQAPHHFVRYLMVHHNSDDGLYTVRDAALPFFDQVKMATFLRTRGYVIESPSRFSTPINDVVFLSHRIIPRYIPSLGKTLNLAAGNLEKIEAGFGWAKNGDLVIQLQRYVALCLNLYPYQVPWDLWTGRVRSWARGYSCFFGDNPSWNVALDMIASDNAALWLHFRWDVSSGFAFSPVDIMNVVDSLNPIEPHKNHGFPC